MRNPKTLDLQECESPADVLTVLRNAAQKFREDQSEPQSAWQDRNAGRPWSYIATNLERMADVLERRLHADGAL